MTLLFQEPRIPLPESLFNYLIFDGLFIPVLLLGFPVVSANDAGGPFHNDLHYVRTQTAGKYSCSCLCGSDFYAVGRLRLRLWLSYCLPSSTQL